MLKDPKDGQYVMLDKDEEGKMWALLYDSLENLEQPLEQIEVPVRVARVIATLFERRIPGFFFVPHHHAPESVLRVVARRSADRSK